MRAARWRNDLFAPQSTESVSVDPNEDGIDLDSKKSKCTRSPVIRCRVPSGFDGAEGSAPTSRTRARPPSRLLRTGPTHLSSVR